MVGPCSSYVRDDADNDDRTGRGPRAVGNRFKGDPTAEVPFCGRLSSRMRMQRCERCDDCYLE